MELFANTFAFFNKCQLFLFISFFCLYGYQAEGNAERRCFSFTWLGPSFNNQSIFMNATCQDATRLSAGVPCVQPLVVSKDGTWPDVQQIWTEYRQAATCVLNDNDVCAQFTYYFNGRPENSTYMCTRAVNTMGAAITSGCYQQVIGSAATKVCFCRSFIGGEPCNNGIIKLPSISMVILMICVSKFCLNKLNK